MGFDKNFVWGSATASYQIEGAWNEDGRGLSVWDVFCHEKGHIDEGHTGDVACDHYHRFREDVRLMKDLGIKAYRFSISWTRIFPKGIGEINEAGVRFYSNLLDELITNSIEPYITLFHWDYPYELYCKGGWLNDESVNWFADYAAKIAELFSDTGGANRASFQKKRHIGTERNCDFSKFRRRKLPVMLIEQTQHASGIGTSSAQAGSDRNIFFKRNLPFREDLRLFGIKPRRLYRQILFRIFCGETAALQCDPLPCGKIHPEPITWKCKRQKYGIQIVVSIRTDGGDFQPEIDLASG